MTKAADRNGPSIGSGGSVDGSLSRGLQVLSAVSAHGAPMTIGEVIDATDMSRATAYRTLELLALDGWLTASGRPKRFTASMRVALLGLQALRRNRAREVTLSNAIVCAQATGMSCLIGTYDNGEAIFLDGVTMLGDRITIASRAGRTPAACTAIGKILLAYQTDEELEKVAMRGLPQFTRYTKTDPNVILDDMRICRSRQYAVADREYAETSGGVAAAVFDHSGNVAAAIGIYAPEVPVADAFIQLVSPTLLIIGKRASAELGYHASDVERFV